LTLSFFGAYLDVDFYHGMRGSASPVLTATGFVNGIWQFSNPHRIHTPSPITKKFVASDYVGDPYGCAKFGANPSTGGLLGKWVKYNEIFFIYLFIPFFMNSPTGQTRRRIFTLYGSNDVDSRKDVPFGGFVGFVDIAPHFGGEIPQKPRFLGRG